MSKMKPLHACHRITDAVLVPVEGSADDAGDTMNLSTPIGTTQDGPRMTSTFGSKKAAPFVKGGGRSKTHPNDAKGKKRAAAKAAFAKKTKDYSAESHADIDLGFSPREPRGTNGRWVKEAMRAGHGPQSVRNAIRHGSDADYQAGYTTNQERNKVVDLLDAADAAARDTQRASKHTVAKRAGKTRASKESLRHKAKSAVHSYFQRPISLSTEADSIDLGFFGGHDVSKEARNSRGEWASIAEPSKAQGAFLKARNELAQARLEGSPHKIARAKKTVAKTEWKLSQEESAKRAVARAAAYYARQETATTLAQNHTRMERVIPPEAPKTPGVETQWEKKRRSAKEAAMLSGSSRAGRKAYARLLADNAGD